MKKLFFAASIIILKSQPIFGMQDIRRWEDAMSFAGKIVLYTTISDDFFSNKDDYLIDPEDHSLRVGFVNSVLCRLGAGETGFIMTRLLKKGIQSVDCNLIDSRLTAARLKIRNATREERSKIAQAVNGGDAELDYMQCCKKQFQAQLGK